MCGRLVALAYKTIRQLGCYFYVLQGYGIQERQGRGSNTGPAKHKQPLKPEKETALFTTIHTTVVYPYDTASKKTPPQLSKTRNPAEKAYDKVTSLSLSHGPQIKSLVVCSTLASIPHVPISISMMNRKKERKNSFSCSHKKSCSPGIQETGSVPLSLVLSTRKGNGFGT